MINIFNPSGCFKSIGMALISSLFTTVCFANDSVQRIAQDTSGWANPGGNYDNWRYSSLAQINNKNAGKLKIDWSFSTGSLQGHAGGPLVLPTYVTGLRNNILVIQSLNPDTVMAINLESQQLQWLYEAEELTTRINSNCCQSQHHGLSYADGKIFMQQSNQRMVALEVRTGRKIWEVATGNDSQLATEISATTAVKDYVLSGFESFGEVGLSAHSIDTGRVVWRAFNQGNAAETLTAADSRYYGVRPATNFIDRTSTTIPGQIAWDEQLNLIFYVSTSQVSKDPVNQSILYSTTVNARDADTGYVRWQYQIAPDQGLPFHTTGELILFNIEEEGSGVVPAIVYFANNGFLYVFERSSGKFLKAEPFADSQNWAEIINPENGRPVETEIDAEGFDRIFCPASIGARSHQPSAYSPRTNLFYVQPHKACMKYEKVPVKAATNRNPLNLLQNTLVPQTRIEKHLLAAGMVANNGNINLGSVAAWDISTGKDRWVLQERWPVMSGVLVTAGDVLFYGTLDGYVKAVDAKTGAYLWHFKAPSGVTGSFSTWEYKDKQYVAVMAGSADAEALLDSDVSLDIPVRRGGSLLVFSLP